MFFIALLLQAQINLMSSGPLTQSCVCSIARNTVWLRTENYQVTPHDSC